MSNIPEFLMMGGTHQNAKRILIILVLGWMAFYPIYTSYYKANAVEQYERHMNHVSGNSMFFNPWQYRILCPLIIEGLYHTANATIFELIPISGVNLNLPGDVSGKNPQTQKLIKSLENPEFIKYTLIFLFFRFTEGLLLLLLAYKYFMKFSPNSFITSLALMILTLFMGNGVVDADLTLNTYLDVILYLAAGVVIFSKANPLWIIVITFFGATNRETSLLIPAIYFFTNFSWSSWPSVPKLLKDNSKVVATTVASAIVFFAVFIGIRMYYGLQPVSSWRVDPGLPMLKLNLFSSVSVKTYMEFFGIFGFLPLTTWFVFRNLDTRLKIITLVIAPIWILLHVSTAIAYQTRLFLVPTVMVFIPAMLQAIKLSLSKTEINGKPAE